MNDPLIIAIQAVGFVTVMLGVVTIAGLFIAENEDKLIACDTMRFTIFATVFIFIGIALLLIGQYKGEKLDDDRTFARYQKDIRPDSDYTCFYNGFAVSGSALGITRENINNYNITFDDTNKAVRITGR